MSRELLDPDVIREGAGEGPIGQRVLVFRETASTNDLALTMGENGEAEGLVIIAERQTAGRGRFRRPWHSADGLGLWFSVLIRREIVPEEITLLTPYVAVCVWEALMEEVPGTGLRIKRPNDIYGQRGKVAGILIETRVGRKPFAVLGMGINVNQREEDFPEELRETASSLALESGGGVSRPAIACAILRRLNARLNEVTAREKRYLSEYERLAGD